MRLEGNRMIKHTTWIPDVLGSRGALDLKRPRAGAMNVWAAVTLP